MIVVEFQLNVFSKLFSLQSCQQKEDQQTCNMNIKAKWGHTNMFYLKELLTATNSEAAFKNNNTVIQSFILVINYFSMYIILFK